MTASFDDELRASDEAPHATPEAEALGDGDAVAESDEPEHVRFKLTRDLNKRLDRYLCDRFQKLSRSRLQKLINEGAVKVNGREPKSSTVIRLGDVIDITMPPPNIKLIPPEDIPLDVLYEDDHIIVINKQADLVVHPARSNTHGTLLNALAWYFREHEARGLESLSKVGVDELRPGIVHRLDKDTTGCIVLAKNENTHWKLSRQFEQRQVQKYYLAITHGEMRPPGDVIDQPIGKHPVVKEACAVRHDVQARHAVTIYRVREVYDGYSLVELELKTGRTHQIRVHLTFLGHPIISDVVYGGEPFGEAELIEPPTAAGSQSMMTFARTKPEGLKVWSRMDRREDLLIRRPALHAAVLSFRHPHTGQAMTFTAPLAGDMAGAVGRLRRDRPKSGVLAAEGAGVDLGQALGGME
jgi:23S rRNA pseudouridine1911/1915/1917 synthase